MPVVSWSLALLLIAGSGAHVQTPTAASLRSEAFALAYNLDYPEAVAMFDKALALDPNDSATHRARATAAWLHIIFRRGSITVDQYLGGASRRDMKMEKPPAEEAAIFTRHVNRALELAERRLAANPKDAAALYDLGAAVGLQASYVATVEGRLGGAFRAARRAYDTHERVLALDPSRKDAGLTVGTYRYVVATLSLPARWVAYLAGFGGDKSRGLRLIEEAVALSVRQPGGREVRAAAPLQPRGAIRRRAGRPARSDDAVSAEPRAAARDRRHRDSRSPVLGGRARAQRGDRTALRRSAAARVRRREHVVLQARAGATGAAPPRAGTRRPHARARACRRATG